MNCSPPGSSGHGKNTGVGCHALLQGIFQAQGLNSRFLHLLHWQASATWEAWCLPQSDQLVMSATEWSISDVCHWLRKEESTHKLMRIPIHRTKPSSDTIFTNTSWELEFKCHMSSKITGLPYHSSYISRQLTQDSALYKCFFPFLPSTIFLSFLSFLPDCKLLECKHFF